MDLAVNVFVLKQILKNDESKNNTDDNGDFCELSERSSAKSQ